MTSITRTVVLAQSNPPTTCLVTESHPHNSQNTNVNHNIRILNSNNTPLKTWINTTCSLNQMIQTRNHTSVQDTIIQTYLLLTKGIIREPMVASKHKITTQHIYLDKPIITHFSFKTTDLAWAQEVQAIIRVPLQKWSKLITHKEVKIDKVITNNN
jgi:hypothetical protein